MMTRILAAKAFILIAAMFLSSALPKSQEQADPARLAAVLKKSADYCRRLDQAALDFICFEEVTEFSRHSTPHTDIYLYDYQFIRKNEETKERRNLISVNGKKTDIQDTALHTAMFQYKNVLFGPVGLLSQSWQGDHKCQFAGEDTIHSERAVIIEATPGADLARPHLYGKIWVSEDETRLRRPLSELGMGISFDRERADFSGMLTVPPGMRAYIHDVLHKTFCEVNEEGTEAAAVTSVEVRVTSVMKPVERFEMICDRPFFFAIVDDETGLILFMGALVNPSDS